MKIRKPHLAIAVAACLTHGMAEAVQSEQEEERAAETTTATEATAQETPEQVMPIVTTTASQVSAEMAEVPYRTELGKLTPYTPLAGTVVGPEELETVRFIDSFHDLLPRVPGVSMSRNLRFTDGAKNYTENRIDGMRARNTGTYTFIDQMNAGDIERIEIIRGPGSVLSGSNAIGGTINVITRDPPRQPEYQVSTEAFSDGGYRAGVTAGAPVTDGIGYFLNANYLDHDGWREHSAETKESFSTKWQFRPDAASVVKVRLEYIHDDYQDPGKLTEAEFDQDWQQAQPGSFFRTDIQYVTPSLHYRRLFGEMGELNLYAQRRLTDSTAKTSVTGSINDNKATEDNLQVMYRQLFETGQGAVTGGVDLMETDSHTWNYQNLSQGSFQFIRGTMTGNSIAQESHRSPFLQYEVSPLKRLRLTAGVRWDNIEYQIDDQLRDYRDGSKEYSRQVEKFGAVYEFNDHHLIWLNVAEGFMGPGVSTLIGSGTPTPATHAAAESQRYVPTNMNLEPEDSITRELGVRGSFASGLQYDIGYYETDFRNLIVSELCGAEALCYSRYVNAASAHASGFETALAYPVTSYLDIGLSHTYANYQYDDYVSGSNDYSGHRRYYTPRNHFNVRAMVKPAAGWRVELEMDHIDSYYTNQALTDSYDRPDLYHLRANYTGKQWAFSLQALNLFNTKYAERVGSTDAGVRNSYTAGYTPLTLRAGVTYNF